MTTIEETTITDFYGRPLRTGFYIQNRKDETGAELYFVQFSSREENFTVYGLEGRIAFADKNKFARTLVRLKNAKGSFRFGLARAGRAIFK